MGLLKQIREVSLSVLPIAVVSALLSTITGAAGPAELLRFLISCICVIIGLSIFLIGVNNGLLPIGNRIGSSVTRMRSLLLIMVMGFVLGAIITYAEPDVTVLSNQVSSVKPEIDSGMLVLAIALARTILHISLKVILFVCYFLLVAFALMQEEFFVSVAFDSGGATTGPLSVPFVMALGMGVAATRKKDPEADFGYVAMASIGPVLAVLLLGMFSHGDSTAAVSVSSAEVHTWYILLASKALNVGSSLAPLLAVCILMQIFVLKLPPVKMMRVLIGIIFSYIGLVVFSFGVDWSFSSIAGSLGSHLAAVSNLLAIVVGGVFGACVVLAEPAIWVLTEQVEEVSLGRISKKMLMIFLCVAVSLALMISLSRALYGLSIWFFLLPGYVIILLLLIRTPKLFGAIAFDSGGVATGPMSSTFLLPFVIGAAGESSAGSGFGMIAMIAMMPVISIELLGLIYSGKLSRKGGNVA